MFPPPMSVFCIAWVTAVSWNFTSFIANTIFKFLLHQAEKYNSNSYKKLELDWKGKASFGCIFVMTEPPLEDLIDRKAKLLHKTRLRHLTAGFLSEGCLKSRYAYGGVKRRRLWPDFDPSLAQLWIKSCPDAHPFKKRPHGHFTVFMRAPWWPL